MTFAMVGAMVAVVVWFYGEVFGQATRDARISVLVWLPLVVLLFSLAYMVAIFFGLDKAIGRLFASDEADPEPARKSRNDARLDDLRHELRRQLGWRWRYRMPWLMLCGDDTAIHEVAPGLKQAGAWCTDEAVLIHPSPDGIEAGL